MAKKAAAKKVVAVVTELDLITIETNRLKLAEIRKQERQLKAALEQQEENVITLLRAGAVVQGGLSAVIETSPGVCRPKYQELWVKHMAEHGVAEKAALEQAKEAYPAVEKEELVIGKNVAV